MKVTMISAGDVLEYSLTLNIIISILLGLSLQYVWSLLNCLQIISYFGLIEVNYPLNFKMFLDYVLKVRNFDYLEN